MSNPEQMNKEALTKEELYATMQEQFKINARLPYRWEWKYAAALALLKIGRDIKFVKDTLRLTYSWMIRQGLIKTSTINGYEQLIPAWI